MSETQQEVRVLVDDAEVGRAIDAIRHIDGVNSVWPAPIQWGVRWRDAGGQLQEIPHASKEKALEFVDVWRHRLPEHGAQLIHRTEAGAWLDDNGRPASDVPKEPAGATVRLKRRTLPDRATYHADRVAAILEDPNASAQQIRDAAVAALIGLRGLAADLAADA